MKRHNSYESSKRQMSQETEVSKRQKIQEKDASIPTFNESIPRTPTIDMEIAEAFEGKPDPSPVTIEDRMSSFLMFIADSEKTSFEEVICDICNQMEKNSARLGAIHEKTLNAIENLDRNDPFFNKQKDAINASFHSEIMLIQQENERLGMMLRGAKKNY
jgi:hypothetical protein